MAFAKLCKSPEIRVLRRFRYFNAVFSLRTSRFPVTLVCSRLSPSKARSSPNSLAKEPWRGRPGSLIVVTSHPFPGKKNGWHEATHHRGTLSVVEWFLAQKNPQQLAVSKNGGRKSRRFRGWDLCHVAGSRSSVMDNRKWQKNSHKVPRWKTYSRDQKVVLEHVSLFWHITVLRATLHYQSFALACFCLVQFCLISVSDLLVCFSHCLRYRLQQSLNIGWSKHRKQGPFTEWTFRWEFDASFLLCGCGSAQTIIYCP